MSRWKEAGQQYPPWQFRTQALVRIAGTDRTPDAATREWLQGLPSGYTASGSEHERCTQLGNAWHCPLPVSALFGFGAVPGNRSGGTLPGRVVRTRSRSDTRDQVSSRWQPSPVRAASFWFRSGLAWDPKEPVRPGLQGPADDPFAHLKWSLDLDFLDLFPVRLNPCLQWCYDTQPVFQGTQVAPVSV